MGDAKARVVYGVSAVALRTRTDRGLEVFGQAFTVLAEDTTFGRQRAEYLPLERLRAEYPREQGWRHQVYLSAISRENLTAALDWLDGPPVERET